MPASSNSCGVGPKAMGSGLLVIVFASVLSLASIADARITQLQVVRVESPTFGGITFGSVGAYEKITARAFGEVDPTLPANALMTDIQFAPRNSRGMVEYSTDVFILKPIDPSLGSGKIFYDVVNRGNKGSYTTFNQAAAPSGVANTNAAGAGTGLLMRRGYTIVWSGWEDPAIIGTGANTLTAALPVARLPGGGPIVDRMIIEQIFDNATGTDISLPYAAANLDQSQAYMVVHNHTSFVGGPLVDRVTVPTSAWSYVNDTTVRINRAHPFLAPYDQGAAFEFVFPARDPIVLALGFAATRDLISFLKHDTSTQNPVRNAIQYALGRGDSQSGRYLKGFLYWGFNADENGQIVFEGMSPHISGSHAIASNDRFGDSNATGRSYQRHLTAKMEFPFTYEVRTDPFTGATDGILRRCLTNGTCPKIMHTDSGNEPYLKPVSLVTTDGPGNGIMPTDLVLPANVRVYTIGSTQHGPAGNVSTTPSGVCQQPANPNQWSHHVRALGIALDDWVNRRCSAAAESIRESERRYPGALSAAVGSGLPGDSRGNVYGVVQPGRRVGSDGPSGHAHSGHVLHHPGTEGGCRRKRPAGDSYSGCAGAAWNLYRLGVASCALCGERRLRAHRPVHTFGDNQGGADRFGRSEAFPRRTLRKLRRLPIQVRRGRQANDQGQAPVGRRRSYDHGPGTAEGTRALAAVAAS